MEPATILAVVEIAGGLLVIAGIIWGVVMRPLAQRMSEAESNIDDHETRLRDAETHVVAHGVEIKTMTTNINNLVTKLDMFMQQMLLNNKE